MQHWLVCSTLIINMLNESCLHCGMGMSYMTCFRANISSLASSILSVALNMSYIMTTNFLRYSVWRILVCLPAVMSYLHSMTKGKRVHGKYKMYGLRHLLFLETSTFYICHELFSPLSWNADTTSQPVNRPVYVKQNILSCKYNCMLELLRLPLVLHILQMFFMSLKAMHLLMPIRPKWWS
jgi:hypothetical protein